MMMALHCPWCGVDLPAGAPSCVSCGRVFSERPQYADALDGALLCVDGLIARRAAFLLGKWRDWRAVPALARALDTGGPFLGVEVVAALGRIGTPDAIAVVRTAARHPWPEVRHAAEDVLSAAGTALGHAGG